MMRFLFCFLFCGSLSSAVTAEDSAPPSQDYNLLEQLCSNGPCEPGAHIFKMGSLTSFKDGTPVTDPAMPVYMDGTTNLYGFFCSSTGLCPGLIEIRFLADNHPAHCLPGYDLQRQYPKVHIKLGIHTAEALDCLTMSHVIDSFYKQHRRLPRLEKTECVDETKQMMSILSMVNVEAKKRLKESGPSKIRADFEKAMADKLSELGLSLIHI